MFPEGTRVEKPRQGFFFLWIFFFAIAKLHLSTASQLSLKAVCYSQTCTVRSVAPFPLKVLRLSGTPESPPDFLGRGKARERAFILAIAKMERCGLCFDEAQRRVRIDRSASIFPIPLGMQNGAPQKNPVLTKDITVKSFTKIQ